MANVDLARIGKVNNMLRLKESPVGAGSRRVSKS